MGAKGEKGERGPPGLPAQPCEFKFSNEKIGANPLVEGHQTLKKSNYT